MCSLICYGDALTFLGCGLGFLFPEGLVFDPPCEFVCFDNFNFFGWLVRENMRTTSRRIGLVYGSLSLFYWALKLVFEL